jgi:hypothetical protein
MFDSGAYYRNVRQTLTRSIMPPKKVVPLPAAIIPFILANVEGFDVVLEDSERIIITPKTDAQINPSSVNQLAEAIASSSRAPAPAPRAIVMRPKFTYKVKDRRYTPEQAKVFGLSKPRLLVYTIIHEHEKGVGYATIRETSKLVHGSVMQILHWLKKQNLITGEPQK